MVVSCISNLTSGMCLVGAHCGSLLLSLCAIYVVFSFVMRPEYNKQSEYSNYFKKTLYKFCAQMMSSSPIHTTYCQLRVRATMLWFLRLCLALARPRVLQVVLDDFLNGFEDLQEHNNEFLQYWAELSRGAVFKDVRSTTDFHASLHNSNTAEFYAHCLNPDVKCFLKIFRLRGDLRQVVKLAHKGDRVQAFVDAVTTRYSMRLTEDCLMATCVKWNFVGPIDMSGNFNYLFASVRTQYCTDPVVFK